MRASHDWLLPIYERMKDLMMNKSLLHIDKTYGQILYRSDGKSGQTNAYNWVSRSVPCQGPPITLFHSALSRLDLSLKVSLKAFLERLFAMVILPMISWKALPSQIIGHMFVVIG
nr:transposase [Neobacillus mesonae]